MTPDLLREAGQALYGSTWQSDMARGLDVAVRTVQRWASGASAIPASVAGELRALGDERIAAWRIARAKLPK
jgi:hypothetical protein